MRILSYLLVSITLIGSTGSSIADTTIGSWNIRHLGYDQPTDYELVATISQNFDILGIQEVMSETAIDRLISEIELQSDQHWNAMVSHSIGRGSYKEHYAFIWNESAVEYLDGAVVFLDHADVFAREPLSARFRSLATGDIFALANIHVLYGQGVKDREPEISALADYWLWLGETYPETPLILMGDFNYEPHMHAWNDLLALGAVPAISEGATTLSPRDGRFVSLFDNIWYDPSQMEIAHAGAYDFPAQLRMPHEEAIRTISDHLPIYVHLANTHQVGAPIGYAGSSSYNQVGLNSNNSDQRCIDLNVSVQDELIRLPHIGNARAQAIVNNRPWSRVEQLEAIRGIGKARLNEIILSGLLCQ